MANRDEVFAQLRTLLVEMFDIDAEAVVPRALLYDDLDIDSIDAVDLVVRLQETTGKKIQPEVFKSARTVADVVDAVVNLLQR
jgi:acyl carrier protein